MTSRAVPAARVLTTRIARRATRFSSGQRVGTALIAATCAVALFCAGCASTFEDGDAEFGEAVEIALPSQDEADAAAARRIHADNADAEFEMLNDEVDSVP